MLTLEYGYSCFDRHRLSNLSQLVLLIDAPCLPVTATMTTPPITRNFLIELDPALYNLSLDQITFLKQQTGIETDKELKSHVLAIQRDAWEVIVLSLGTTISTTHEPFATGCELSVHSLLWLRFVGTFSLPGASVSSLSFRLRITEHPSYSKLLKIGKERPDAIFLEFACCCAHI